MPAPLPRVRKVVVLTRVSPEAYAQLAARVEQIREKTGVPTTVAAVVRALIEKYAGSL